MQIRHRALAALALTDVQAKLDATLELARSVAHAAREYSAGQICADVHQTLHPAGLLPGRPQRPELVSPAAVPRRSPSTAMGRAALMHAVAHIEFNAINLALDAVWRFPHMPDVYYRDWIQVAGEEAQHFAMVQDHLRHQGHAYGDFAAHNGLWEMVEKTRDDVTARMALVPRTLEARGLDATPPIQRKLAQAGDGNAVAILDVILRDEIGHVAIGNRWYRWCCAREGLDPVQHYARLAKRHAAPGLKGPFNLAAREQAGFTPDELSALQLSTATPAMTGSEPRPQQD
jgi:uncharacterized ferritin-like protein (DUF455 family)